MRTDPPAVEVCRVTHHSCSHIGHLWPLNYINPSTWRKSDEPRRPRPGAAVGPVDRRLPEPASTQADTRGRPITTGGDVPAPRPDIHPREARRRTHGRPTAFRRPHLAPLFTSVRFASTRHGPRRAGQADRQASRTRPAGTIPAKTPDSAGSTLRPVAVQSTWGAWKHGRGQQHRPNPSHSARSYSSPTAAMARVPRKKSRERHPAVTEIMNPTPYQIRFWPILPAPSAIWCKAARASCGTVDPPRLPLSPPC